MIPCERLENWRWAVEDGVIVARCLLPFATGTEYLLSNPIEDFDPVEIVRAQQKYITRGVCSAAIATMEEQHVQG